MSASDWLLIRRVETTRRHRDPKVGRIVKHVSFEVSDGTGEPIDGHERVEILDRFEPEWRKAIQP